MLTLHQYALLPAMIPYLKIETEKITWRSAKARSPFYYEQHRSAERASTYGLISSAIYLCKNTFAWGVLGYGAYQIGKSM